MCILMLFILTSFTNVYLSECFSNTSVKIVGGNVVKIEDYPFQVALIQDGKLWCGGTIVAEDRVLTAAHCIIFADSPLSVRAGTSVWNKGGSVHQVIFKATYGPKPSTDLAVLRVEPPFVLDKTRQPIDLFYKGEETSAGTMGTVLGWGSTSYVSTSQNLRAVDLPVVDHETCKEMYKDTVIGTVVDGQLCAGYTDETHKDSCQGDSGGPFVIDGRQAGITSMGIGCAQPEAPGILTDVGFFNEWIIEQIYA